MIQNNPQLAGQIAGKKEMIGGFQRYAVYPVHTRFANVQWFVADAETLDGQGVPVIIRQSDSKEAAVAGLILDEIYCANSLCDMTVEHEGNLCEICESEQSELEYIQSDC